MSRSSVQFLVTGRRPVGPYSLFAAKAQAEHEEQQSLFAGESAQARDAYDSWCRTYAAPGYARSAQIISEQQVADFYR